MDLGKSMSVSITLLTNLILHFLTGFWHIIAVLRRIFPRLFFTLAFLPAVAFSEKLSVETFFRDFEHREVEISPDGNFLGVLAPVKHRVALAVIDLKKDVATYAFADRQADVMWFQWANTNRLLLRLGKDGYVAPGLLAVNRDGSKPITLVTFGDTRTHFLSFLPDSPDEILVASTEHAERLADTYLRYPHVERMNIITGHKTREVTNPGKVFSWVVDRKGIVRVGVRLDLTKFSVLYRPDAKAPWSTLQEYDYSNLGIWPEGFEYDNKTLLVRWTGGKDTDAIYTYDVDNKKIKALAFRHAEVDVERLIFSKLERQLVGVSCHTERPEVYWFHPNLKRLQTAVDHALTNTINVLLNRTADGSKAIFLAYNDKTPGTYYLMDTAELRLQKLFDAAEWIHPEDMAEMKPIEYTARDGLKIHGYLTLPKGSPGKLVPLVVNPHGGPESRDFWSFHREVQFLANRGYAVLQMNFRGSTGYGNAFHKAGYQQWGLKQQDDITDGVKWAIDNKIADPKHIAIYGASYGGYAVLVGLEKTPEFYCCGICYVGVTDIIRTFRRDYDTTLYRSRVRDIVGDLKEDKDRLKDASPLTHVDQIQVPVFLAYGQLDPKVPVATGRDLARELKKRGKLYDYMEKDDEGHGFYKESNRIEFWKKVDEFLSAKLAN